MLTEVVVKYLRRIESELDSRAGVAKLKSFISLTREGMEVIEAGLSVLAPNTLVRSIEKLSGTSHRKAVDKNALIFPEFRLSLSRFGFSMVKKTAGRQAQNNVVLTSDGGILQATYS